MNMRMLFFTLLLLACFSVRSDNAEYFYSKRKARQELSKQLRRYTRPFTYLEIVETEPLWALDIAQTYPESSIIVLVVGADSETLLCRLKQEHPENIVVLHPKKFGLYELEMLGLCESIDQFVMPDLSSHFGEQWSLCIEAASRIAPHSIIETASWKASRPADFSMTDILQSCRTLSSMTGTGGFVKAAYGFGTREGAGLDGSYMASRVYNNDYEPYAAFLPQQRAAQKERGLSFWRSQYCQKKGIMLGRWPTDQLDIEKIQLPDEPPYVVTSTYDSKIMRKQFCEKPQEMVPGINLKTFVMLRGVWPEDDVLTQKIQAFETAAHNDLVENNLIISGITIVPIDTDDLRWCGDLSLCVARILSLFKDTLRMDDPRAAIKRLDTYACITLQTAQKHQQMIKELFPEAEPSGTVVSSIWIGVPSEERRSALS